MNYENWYEKKNISTIKNIDNEDILIFDAETTSNIPTVAELLSLTIMNRNGDVLFDNLIKPKKATSWKEAQRINHISYDDVKDKPHIDEYLEQLNKIFSKAKLLVGYNSNDFDIPVLENHGVIIPNVLNFDVMREFGCVKGKYTSSGFDFKISLAKCCLYYDVENNEAHKAISDTEATLNCFNKMLEDEEETGYYTFANSKLSNSYWWSNIRAEGANDRPYVNFEGLIGCNDKDKLTTKLGLPKTKQLVYKRTYNGFDEEHNVEEFIVDKAYRTFCILAIKLENGEEIKVHCDYFNEMQADSFFDNRTLNSKNRTDAHYRKSLNENLTLDDERTNIKFDDNTILEFKDKKYIITGNFENSKWKDEQKTFDTLVELGTKGLKETDKVSSKTDYVVVGNLGDSRWKSFFDGGTKIKDAYAYNVPVIREKRFIEALEEALDEKQN